MRDSLKKQEKHDKECLDKHLLRVKEWVQEQGFINGDAADIKLDLKHRPLCFYQEGADLIPVSTYIERIVDGAFNEKRYSKQVGKLGDGTFYANGPAALMSDVMKRQLALIAPVITKEDIEAAKISGTMKWLIGGIMQMSKTKEVPPR